MRAAVAPRDPRDPAPLRRAASVVTVRALPPPPPRARLVVLAGARPRRRRLAWRRGGPLRAFRVGRGSPSRGVHARADRGRGRAAPNGEWPPPDVVRVQGDARGDVVRVRRAFPFRRRARALATGEVAPAPQWRRTRASSAFAGPAKIQGLIPFRSRRRTKRRVVEQRARRRPATYRPPSPRRCSGAAKWGRCAWRRATSPPGRCCCRSAGGRGGAFRAGVRAARPGGRGLRRRRARAGDVRAARGDASERVRLFIDVVADPGAKRNWRIDTIEMVGEKRRVRARALAGRAFTEPTSS